MTIEQMRRNYTMAGLAEGDTDPDPMVQFRQWFEEAQVEGAPDWLEVNAMTVSTTDLAGRVTSRILLLKGIEASGFVFYTNYDSSKGRQIVENPQVSLCFFWPHLQRQVRVNGTAQKTSREQSETYFRSRPRDSQLGAHVSAQSSEVEASTLQRRMEELSVQYADTDIPCPDHWGGYRVTPSAIEFWQGRPSRLHDRMVYRREDESWKIVRLSP